MDSLLICMKEVLLQDLSSVNVPPLDRDHIVEGFDRRRRLIVIIG